MTDIEKSVVKTLAYFDAFDRPLTREELHHNLYGLSGGYQSFLFQLQQMEHWQHIEQRDGYYCLGGRGEIVSRHQSRVRLVEKKMSIARRGVKKMRWVPFVRAVFVCNTVAMGAPKVVSDVDVFIIVKQGRLWVTRFLVTVLLSLFGLRRQGEDVTDKMCLSFYLTDQSFDLFRIASFSDDIYLMYWLDELIPLYDPKDMYVRMRQENAWVKKFVPDALQSHVVLHRWKVKDAWPVRVARGLCSVFLLSIWGDTFERLAKKVQQWKMAKNTKSVQHEPDTRVVVNDEMLKFHENDRRSYYRERWQQRCGEL